MPLPLSPSCCRPARLVDLDDAPHTYWPVKPHFARPSVSVSAADKSAIYAAFLLPNVQVVTAEIGPIHPNGRAERKLVSRDHQSVTEISAALQRPRLTDLQPIELTLSPPAHPPLFAISSLCPRATAGSYFGAARSTWRYFNPRETSRLTLAFSNISGRATHTRQKR